MPKIMNAYTESESKPKIEVSSNAFKITLPNRNSGANHAETLLGTVKGDEKRILDFIGSNGHIVRSDVDRLLEVSQATANRIRSEWWRRGSFTRTETAGKQSIDGKTAGREGPRMNRKAIINGQEYTLLELLQLPGWMLTTDDSVKIATVIAPRALIRCGVAALQRQCI